MRILLKHVTLLNNLEEYYDILIEDRKIKKIENRIDTKEVDFLFQLNGRIISPSLSFILQKPVDIRDYSYFQKLIKNGIKGGYTTYIFQLEKKDIKIEEIKKIDYIFSRNYVKSIFTGKDIEYKGEFVRFKKDLQERQEKTITEGEEGSLVIWNTNEYIDKDLLKIPYMVISMGRIILREGRTIFT